MKINRYTQWDARRIDKITVNRELEQIHIRKIDGVGTYADALPGEKLEDTLKRIKIEYQREITAYMYIILDAAQLN